MTAHNGIQLRCVDCANKTFRVTRQNIEQDYRHIVCEKCDSKYEIF